MEAEQGTALEAAHRHAQAVVSGDIGGALRTMTPDAFGQSMELGNQSWNVTSYKLTAIGGGGEEHEFAVTFETDLGPLALRYRLRDVGGQWKVVDIQRAAS